MTDQRPWVDVRDLVTVARLVVLAAAWTLPERRWAAFCRSLAGVAARGRKWRSRTACFAEFADRHEPALAPPLWARAYLASTFLADMMLMRCHLPGSWAPAWRLDGREHLQSALAAGTGAVLWGAPFASRDLMAKMTLHLAGYPVHHLSRIEHGFSATRVGIMLLNPLRTRIEERYLAARVIMAPEAPAAAMRTLMQCLAGNGIVSVSFGRQGRSVHRVPFLDGALEIAAGAPDLAARCGAALLPVYTVREPDGTLVTTIDAPLDLASGDGRAGRNAAAAGAFAKRLEPIALRHPDQVAWHALMPPAESR